MSEPLPILLLTDGKPGHENQSRGLAEAIERLTPTRLTVLPVEKKGLVASLLQPEKLPEGAPKPRLILGAGHGVHGTMIRLSRSNDAASVVLMKPTLPVNLFDLCLLPRHDLGGKLPGFNMIPTRGALNRVPPPGDQSRRSGLILIGGPSAAYDWDSDEIARAVCQVVDANADRPWRATNSRRTPAEQIETLRSACPGLVVYPHEQTGRDWLPQRLAEAEEVWVSEDSVSMIYEALSSGARVGLLPAHCLKPNGRVASGIDELASDGYLTRFTDWNRSAPLPPPPEVLQESERCARIVLERFFPQLLDGR